MEEKKKINILLNIDNWLGEHEGRKGPALKFVTISCIPPIIYVMLSSYINFKVFLVIQVLFMIRVALFTIGGEDEKLPIYLECRKDPYAATNDLVEVSKINTDGLMEYTDGSVSYVIEMYVGTELDDDVLSLDIEEFLAMLSKYRYDIRFFNVVDEVNLVKNIESIQCRGEMGEERLEFLEEQDNYSKENTKLYKVCIQIFTYRQDWLVLRTFLEGVLKSSAASIFKHKRLCNEEEAIAYLQRDLCAYVDVREMILKKYKNENFMGSRILYYDEPRNANKNNLDKDSGLVERRVIYDSET